MDRIPILLLSACASCICSAGQIHVQFYSPSIVRITKTPGYGPVPDKPIPVVTAKPMDPQPEEERTENGAVWRSAELVVKLDAQSGTVSFHDAGGKLIFGEKCAAEFPEVHYNGKKALVNIQKFLIADDEQIYGLGDWQNGQLDRRGATNRLMVDNVGNGMPYFCSSKGYSVYWDNTGPVWYRDVVGEALTMESEIGDAVDYYFISGGDLDGTVKGMRLLTGDVPMLALECYGFWQCRERYKSQEEIVDTLAKYRELGIPVDGIIQDWQYWGSNPFWNSLDFTSPDYTEPKKMIDAIHDLHAKLMISVWPNFGPVTKPYWELEEKGLLFPFKTFPNTALVHIWPERQDYPLAVKLYDCFSSEARDIFWKYAKNLKDFGIDYWWMDATDTDHRYREGDYEYPTAIGCTFREVKNAYPFMCVKGVYEHQRDEDKEHRPFILTRAGFPGQHRFGSNVWSGDIMSHWPVLRTQISSGLGFSLTGSPMWNCDLGGFGAWEYRNAKMEDPTGNRAWRELYTRWVEYGVFLPMMRSHGTSIIREFFAYGEKGEPIYDALVNAVKMRYELLPYIYSTAWQVHKNGKSFMMPVDGRTDAYLFGDSIFVQPITHALYTDEKSFIAPDDTDFSVAKPYEVTLPEGVWYEYQTGKRYEGGKTHTLSTTMSTIPAFVRAGTILPVGPDVQYATEKPWDDLEVRIYPGADGTFTLYEDAGDGFGYEKGEYTETVFTWNDSEAKLTVDDPKKRDFKIKIAKGE